MKITHVAIWVANLELMKVFYTKYFGGVSNEIYTNPMKHFSSYFISFDDGATLELMHKPEIKSVKHGFDEFIGITHLAFEVGSKSKVDELCCLFRKDGYVILGEPRTSGAGYYECVIADPENNRIEIIA